MKDCQGKELYIGDLVVIQAFWLNRMVAAEIIELLYDLDGVPGEHVTVLAESIEYRVQPQMLFKYAEKVYKCLNCANEDKHDFCSECCIVGHRIPTRWSSDGTDDSYREVVSEYL